MLLIPPAYLWVPVRKKKKNPGGGYGCRQERDLPAFVGARGSVSAKGNGEPEHQSPPSQGPREAPPRLAARLRAAPPQSGCHRVWHLTGARSGLEHARNGVGGGQWGAGAAVVGRALERRRLRPTVSRRCLSAWGKGGG